MSRLISRYNWTACAFLLLKYVLIIIYIMCLQPHALIPQFVHWNGTASQYDKMKEDQDSMKMETTWKLNVNRIGMT